MKPKTKMDRRAMAASKRLPRLTPAQVEWGKKHCFKQRAFWSGKEAWCSRCGGVFPAPSSKLLVNTLTTASLVCPHCGAKLTMERSRRQKIKEKSYLTLLTTCNGMQVQRTFDVVANGRKGSGVDYTFNEVVELWLDDKGAESVIACSRMPFSYFSDIWVYGTLSCKRRDGYVYGNPYMFYGAIYPRMQVIPILKRNGYKPLDNVVPHEQMRALLTDPMAETLQKAGQLELLAYMINRRWRANGHWHAVKIAIRNNYRVDDASMWVDMVEGLGALGLDTHNAHYVCPVDLKEAHDRITERVNRKRRAERRLADLYKARNYEADYRNAKSKFFGLLITDGRINIRPLQSVEEFEEEGRTMHHCVFSGGYYKLEHSLILTARTIEGKRIETIEVDLLHYKVLQSRGVNNINTPEHDHILTLVRNNMSAIKKLVAI